MVLSFFSEEKIVLFVLFVHFVYMVQKYLVHKKDLVDQISNYYFVDETSLILAIIAFIVFEMWWSLNILFCKISI